MDQFSPSSLSEDRRPGPPPRRRRDRRRLSPLNELGRDEVLRELARNASPRVEFFFLLALAALIQAAGSVIQNVTVVVAGSLVAPFMAPVLGLSLAAATGSARFFVRALAALLLAGLIAVALSALAGWIVLQQFGPELLTPISEVHGRPNPVDLGLAFVGGVLTALALVRSPQAAAVPSVAIAYELVPSLAAIGFGLAGGRADLWQNALMISGLHLSAVLLGALAAFLSLGLRPAPYGGRFPHGLDTWLAASVLIVLILGANLWGIRRHFGWPRTTLVFQPEPTFTRPAPATLPGPSPLPSQTSTASPRPSATATPRATSTPTMTRTPTVTATPFLARVLTDEGNGALLRDRPEGEIVAFLPENTVVEILEGPVPSGEFEWMKVRDSFGQEGWLAEIVFATITPEPSSTP